MNKNGAKATYSMDVIFSCSIIDEENVGVGG